MIDYKKYINALRKCAKEHENDKTPLGHVIVSDLCRDTANLLEEVEQEPKTGHWVRKSLNEYHCGVCDEAFSGVDFEYDYCPKCGAKMEDNNV